MGGTMTTALVFILLFLTLGALGFVFGHFD
jgi:hypothetical protein